LGRSVIVFREVLIDWVHDINAVAYFLSGGDPVAALNFDRIKIASSTYLNAADVYCDGASDETEINGAIAGLAGAGGGIVELTEGTFVTDEKIVPANSIGIIGHGWNTIIEKNGDYHGIELIGSSGSEYENIHLSNFRVTRNASDENADKYLVYLEYVDNFALNNIICDGGYSTGCFLNYCDNFNILECNFINNGAHGLAVIGTPANPAKARIIGNICSDNTNDGMIFNGIDHSTISSNTCLDNGDSGIAILDGEYCSITSNICEGNGGGGADSGLKLTSASNNNVITGNICNNNNAYGISVASGDRNVVSGNRATGNTTSNFDDSGTNTTFANLNDFN